MAKPPAISDRLHYEKILRSRGIRSLAGVDEAGRGPLAGPVCAAAVVFPVEWFESGFPHTLRELNDSKQLSELQRETFFGIILGDSSIQHGIAKVDAAVIDRINILQATHRAMNEALSRLPQSPEHALVDGRPVTTLCVPQTALVKGDSLSYSIAAASVLAKVTRDRLMLEYDEEFPGYGFAEHKGYGTPAHLAAIAKLGPCPIHRKSFSPIKPRELELF